MSSEPVNGLLSPDDEEDDYTESTAVSSTRSVSSTIHERSTKVSSSAPNSSMSTSDKQRQSRSTHHHHHHQNNDSRRSSSTTPGATASNSGTAKDTFLNYFFGGADNGPTVNGHLAAGPVASVGLSAAMSTGSTPTARDTSETPAPTGLLASKVSGDSHSAAYDMKSLGKHIEAVSISFLSSTRILISDVALPVSFPRVKTPPSLSAKRWKQTSSALSLLLISTLSGKLFKTSFLRPSCTSSSITLRNKSRTGWWRHYTSPTFSRPC